MLEDYKTHMIREMSEVWKKAQKCVQKAQKRQKVQHDKRATPADFKIGERVFVHMPALKSGPAYKLAHPFKGPYQVVENYPNGVGLVPVDKPRATPIRVALNRMRRCPGQIQNETDHQEVDYPATCNTTYPVCAEEWDTEDSEPEPESSLTQEASIPSTADESDARTTDTWERPPTSTDQQVEDDLRTERGDVMTVNSYIVHICGVTRLCCR